MVGAVVTGGFVLLGAVVTGVFAAVVVVVLEAESAVVVLEGTVEEAEDVLDVLGEAEQAVVRGYAGFWYDGEDAELMTIGVGKAYQRQGIAAALLQALVDEAKRQGASRMLLEVRVDNDPALALYQRFGFERMGLRKRYYQPEGIDAYTMSLDLKPRVVGFAAPQTASADIEDITSKQTEKNGEAR